MEVYPWMLYKAAPPVVGVTPLLSTTKYNYSVTATTDLNSRLTPSISKHQQQCLDSGTSLSQLKLPPTPHSKPLPSRECERASYQVLGSNSHQTSSSHWRSGYLSRQRTTLCQLQLWLLRAQSQMSCHSITTASSATTSLPRDHHQSAAPSRSAPSRQSSSQSRPPASVRSSASLASAQSEASFQSISDPRATYDSHNATALTSACKHD